MKFLFLVCVVTIISACQAKDDGGEPKICCGSGPAQMDFKTHDGREIVSWGEVTSADVKILPAKPGNPATPQDKGLERTFTGSQAQLLMRQFNFAWPRQDGMLSAMVTGTVTIHYTHRGSNDSRTRVIEIMDSYLLQDSIFADVTYDPGLTLDKAWLQAQ